jgi:hypothetical protein
MGQSQPGRVAFTIVFLVPYFFFRGGVQFQPLPI